MTTYNLGDATYGLDLSGATDSTIALQTAFASIPTGSKIYLPSEGSGIKLSATVAVTPNSELYSDGWDPITVQRDSNYGDTFTVGDNISIPAGSCVFRDMALVHGGVYVQGATTLKAQDGITAMKATSGSHIRIYGSQHPGIINVRAWRMPTQIYFHGGSLHYLENNQLTSVWDDQNVGCQEGVAQIVYDPHAVWGNPQLVKHVRNHLSGPISANRTISYNGVNKTVNNGIGSKQGILIHGMEVGDFDSDYFGGMNQNAVAYQCKSGGFITDQTYRATYFDSTSADQIYIKPDDGVTAMYNLSLHGVSFNGQLKGQTCLFVLPANGSYPGNNPSLYGLDIKGGFAKHMPGAPFRLLGVRGGDISGMKISNYNCYNSSTTDAQWCSAGWVDWQSSLINIHDNQTGGGGQTYDPSSANNHCYQAWNIGSGKGTVDRNTHIAPV